jgi:quinol monooxygenase YgiN
MMATMREVFGLHGRIVALPGQGDALAALLLEAADVLGDGFPECRLYLISRSASDADSIWVTEVWADREAHDASLRDERVRSVIARARPIISGMADSTELRPIGGKGF